jgi:hypothetical protein
MWRREASRILRGRGEELGRNGKGSEREKLI